jgi:hypothetical protein
VSARAGFQERDAFDQIALMIHTMDHSMSNFVTEFSATSAAFFLNFPFWKAAGAERFGLEEGKFAKCLDQIRLAWASSEKPAELIEEAICVP